MDKLTIPATFTIHAADQQKDSRHATATINFVHEGTYFGKYLFSCSAIDAAAPTAQNVTIAAEDGDCALGVIPEGSVPTWALVLKDGKWRNTLQLDCLLWAKTNPNAHEYADFSGKTLNMEAELSITGSEQDGVYTVESFTVDGLRLLSDMVKQSDFTVKSGRYGALPRRKGGMTNGR